MKTMFKDQRGVSLVQLILYLAIASIVMVSGIALANKLMGDGNENEIEGNKATLESSAKAYYTNQSEYPTKPAVGFDESKFDTYLSIFYKQIAYFSGLTNKSLYEGDNKEYQADYDPKYLIKQTDPEKTKVDKVVMSKVLNMDIKGMVTNSYMSKMPKNPDNYFLHTSTGFVYYVDESMSIKEISDEAKRLVSDSGGIGGLSELGNIELKKDGKTMDKIITSVTNGNIVIYGGSGSMVLAKVKIVKNDDNTFSHEITDLTSTLLQGSSTTDAVTELRLMETNKVLAHYFDKTSKKMVYRTIGVE